MQKIKIGQIGICHEHANGKINSLRKMGDVYEIVGVVDDRYMTGAKFLPAELMKPYEGLKFMSEEELLNTPGLQAVTVETPNTDLVQTAMRCMERNLAMHMDKPGGENMKDFAKLLKGCEKKNLPFQMGFMFRNNPAMQFCLDAAQKNWLGDIFEIQTSMNHNYGGAEYQKYLSSFKGGIMFNLGCHLIDFIAKLLGRPDKVHSFLKIAPNIAENPKNCCLAVLEYPLATATVRASSLEVDGLNNRRLKVCGTKGSIELCPVEHFDGKPLMMELRLLEDNEEYKAGTHTIDLGIKTDRYLEQLLELAKIIRGEIKNPYTYKHDYLVQEICLAAAGYTKWRK